MTRIIYFKLVLPFRKFPGSEDYWKQRYRSGGNSGSGSYQKLARFKAEVLNDFVRKKQISTIIEFGCGDGNQLSLSQYPSYLGFDVSPEAILRCESIFANDATKSFQTADAYVNETAELTLSLDVIYHLVEDHVYLSYMERLFDSSTRYVIIFSSNTQEQSRFQSPHVRHRRLSKWIDERRPAWSLTEHIPNRYPYKGKEGEGSLADFYVYEKL